MSPLPTDVVLRIYRQIVQEIPKSSVKLTPAESAFWDKVAAECKEAAAKYPKLVFDVPFEYPEA